MTRTRTTTIGAIAALTLALAATGAVAHSGAMNGDKEGMAGMKGGMGHGMGGGMGHGMGGGMGGGMGAGMAGMHQQGGAGQALMTPQERQALREKMQAAKSPEERQALAAATRAEMEKRAKDKGVSLPEHRGPGAGMGAERGQGPGRHQH
jgi:Spy/CpxP family protein refolding chaperone